MSVVEATTPGRTVSRGTWFVRGLGLGLLGCLLMWVASRINEHAQIEAGSTFQIQRGEILLVNLLFVLVGAVFTVAVLLARPDPSRRSALLIGAALPPLLTTMVFWGWIGGVLSMRMFNGRLLWTMDPAVMTASQMAVGAMATAFVWQAFITRARRGP